MKNIGNKRAGLVGSAFATVFTVVALSAGTAAAATNTVYQWTGAASTTAGAGGCTSNCWSVAGNWNVSTDGGTTFATATTAPQSSDNGGNGDDLLFNPTGLSANVITKNDITGLKVSTLSSKGNNSGSYGYQISGNGFTLVNGVSSTPTDGNYLFDQVNTTVDTLTLNRPNVFFDEITIPTGVTFSSNNSNNSTFHGSGTLDISGNSSYGGYLSFNQGSDFDGTVNIGNDGTMYMYTNAVGTGFAPSAKINVLTGGQIQVDGSDGNNGTNISATIPNDISIAGSGGDVASPGYTQLKGAIIAGTYANGAYAGTLDLTFSGAVSLSADALLSSQHGSASTFNFSQLNLSGHTLSISPSDATNYGTAVVQLAGATVIDGANGQTSYSGAVNASATTGAVAAPKTPDTGFKVLKANPLATLAGSVFAFGALVFMARKAKTSSARR